MVLFFPARSGVFRKQWIGHMFGYDGSTTAGYFKTDSGMGHLYYVEFGNPGWGEPGWRTTNTDRK
jgi:hypothetical protein